MTTHGTSSPLEDFVLAYVEETGGVWEDVEPQVYDLLLPLADGQKIVRVAFDPEALPEHPGSQLASFGTPLIDSLLTDAVHRGRFARFYLVGLNLNPHDLASRVRRSLTLGPEMSFRIDQVRAMHFAQAVFWFQAAFISDQKEMEILPAGMDLHYGRQTRHLDQLLDHARLAPQPSIYLPEARRLSLASAYPVAREEVLRTLAAHANARQREMSERVEKQIGRMNTYYADLRSEVEEQSRRAEARGDAVDKFAERRAALDREQRSRVTELRQKSTLRLQMRLLTLLVVQQPKLLLRLALLGGNREIATVEAVWDLLTETLEALPCPTCHRPTLALDRSRFGRLVCPACGTSSSSR